MGFRSTLTTYDYPIKWPDWFRKKYEFSIGCNGRGALYSIGEHKTYTEWLTLPEDIQKAIDWDEFTLNFVLVYLHECGGITRYQIGKDSIKCSEPKEWDVVEEITHWYCSGCSDVGLDKPL